MKKQIIIRLAFLISASGLFFSCSHMGQKNVGAFEFDSLQVNKTTHLFGDTAKPACNLTVSLSYIKNSSDERIKDSLNAYFLSASLGEDYATLLPEASVKSYAEKYAGNYLNDLEPLYRKDEQEAENREDIGNWYSYYRGVKSHVQHYDGNLLVYRVDYNEYTGGAHGIYMSSFLNFNLSTLSPIRLDDLFVGEYKEQLTDLLWNQLMMDNNVSTRQEVEDLGYVTIGELTPTENFYLSKEGITFYYNVYDIAPYVMGPVEITLPYEMVQHLIDGENGTYF